MYFTSDILFKIPVGQSVASNIVRENSNPILRPPTINNTVNITPPLAGGMCGFNSKIRFEGDILFANNSAPGVGGETCLSSGSTKFTVYFITINMQASMAERWLHELDPISREIE